MSLEAFTGASRGLDIANLKHRFASSNSRARTKISEAAPAEVPGTGGTGRGHRACGVLAARS